MTLEKKRYIQHGYETKKMVDWVAENVDEYELGQSIYWRFTCSCKEVPKIQWLKVFYWAKNKDVLSEEEVETDYSMIHYCPECELWMIDADWFK